jgi:chitodextrinase
LAWNASTDNIGVQGYRVYRNGQKIANQSGTNLTINGLRSRTQYTFTVQAYDAAGNTSGKAQVVVTTLRRSSWWW